MKYHLVIAVLAVLAIQPVWSEPARTDISDQFGEVVFQGPRIFEVGDRVRITQRFRTRQVMETGSAVLLARHWQHNVHMQWQDPSAPDYIEVTASRDGVTLAIRGMQFSGVHGSPYGLARLPLVEITSGTLQAGDELRIVYGAGEQGFGMPPIATDSLSLPLYIRIAPDRDFRPLAVQDFAVRPGPVTRLAVNVPSLVRPNESYILSVRGEDRFGNIAGSGLPSLEIIVDGVFQSRLSASGRATASITMPGFRQEGRHGVTVRSAGGGLVGNSNPMLVEAGSETEIIWAGLHDHSRRSDGIQSPERLDSEAAGVLDVHILADHDSYLVDPRPPVEVSRPLQHGGHYVLLDDTQSLALVLPEVPADHRGLDNPVLVEIRSGDSSYEWLGQFYAGLGYRVGFTGSSVSHRPGIPAARAKTAIIVPRGMRWQDALRQRSTFVTTGSRSILTVRVNGALPGARIAPARKRMIEGSVTAMSGITSIELIRNGVVIDRRLPPATEERQIIDVVFRSSSRPVRTGFDLPRNGREWIGYLRIKGGDIASVDGSGLQPPGRSAVAVNPADPSRADFITWTHGTESRFALSLEESPGDDVLIELNIKDGFEDVDLMPEYRNPAATPGMQQLIAAGEITNDGLVRTMDVEGYTDSVLFRWAGAEKPVQQSFRFTDERPRGIGDYYYVRVKQEDGQMLWSSPVFVGGFDLDD